MPHRKILVRLGHRESRTKLTSAQRDAVEQTMAEGFALCHPQGCWMRLAIAKHQEESVVLEDGTILISASLTRLLRHSVAVAVMAATVGAEIVQAADEAVDRASGATAVIYDAVGGQTADATMGWINELVRQQLRRQGEHLTKHRFSPGYGDLHLDTQRAIHRWLKLDRLGLSLTPGCMLVPEKSVTALAGIEKTSQVEEPHDA